MLERGIVLLAALGGVMAVAVLLAGAPRERGGRDPGSADELRSPAVSEMAEMAAQVTRTQDGSLEVGDAFDVDYRVATLRGLQRSGGAVPGRALARTWRYRIVAEDAQDGRERRILRAAPLVLEERAPVRPDDGIAAALDERSGSDVAVAAITLTVDVDTRALIRLSETVVGAARASGLGEGEGGLAGVRTVDHANRYAVGGPEAMLFPIRHFPYHIADLPRLPVGAADPTVPRSRIVERADGMLPAFEQRLTPLPGGGWEVELRRPDPDSGRELRVWQHWPADGVWWSEARITLGDELLIEGRWLGPAAADALYLPRLLAGSAAP